MFKVFYFLPTLEHFQFFSQIFLESEHLQTNCLRKNLTTFSVSRPPSKKWTRPSSPEAIPMRSTVKMRMETSTPAPTPSRRSTGQTVTKGGETQQESFSSLESRTKVNRTILVCKSSLIHPYSRFKQDLLIYFDIFHCILATYGIIDPSMCVFL